jgi:ParB/RepB/Spo0J family partition protein
MATSTAGSGVAMIALSQIRHDRNVRQQLAPSEVDALAQSISLLGQLTPVSVRSDRDGGYVLIAGHKRYAALAQLGHAEIRAEIRGDSVAEESERAAENIVRTQLNPYEPGGMALDASFDRSDDAIASGLGRFPALAASVRRAGILLLSGTFQRAIRIRCNIVAVIATAGG